MIILTILFTFTRVKISCQYTENCWENRPNVQGKQNSSAQYAVKIVPRRTAPRICARALNLVNPIKYNSTGLLNSVWGKTINVYDVR